MGPVLPGLSDGPEQLAETVDAAVAAGARSVSAVYLHLRGPLREHVLGWASEARPELAERWQRLYGRRANVPTSLQAELSARVEQLAADARRRHLPPPEPLRPERSLPAPVLRRRAPPPPPAEQLSLWGGAAPSIAGAARRSGARSGLPVRVADQGCRSGLLIRVDRPP